MVDFHEHKRASGVFRPLNGSAATNLPELGTRFVL